MEKHRIRKIRGFTINDNIYNPFRKTCEESKKVMSKEVENFMKTYKRGKI
jgi:hypothetical protein